jgi:hypothetical protein
MGLTDLKVSTDAWLKTANDTDVRQHALETEDFLAANGFHNWSYGNSSDPDAIRREYARLPDAIEAEIVRRQPPPPPPPDPAEVRAAEWMERRRAEQEKRDHDASISDMAELFIEDPERASRLWDRMKREGIL